MNKATAIKYLTGPVAFAYKPRRMPWDHDQDRDSTAAKTMLTMWAELLARYNDDTIYMAFDRMMASKPDSVPSFNQVAKELRHEHNRRSLEHTALPESTGPVLSIEEGQAVAWAAYCKVIEARGRTPDPHRFGKKFAAMYGDSN
jgi:hypothetical protein